MDKFGGAALLNRRLQLDTTQGVIKKTILI